MGEMAYQAHDRDIRLLIAKLTFFTLYVDDKSSRCDDPTPFTEFQQRYTLSMPQSDPVLDQFVICLKQVWTHWDPISANAIVTAILEFVNGCCIENSTTGMQLNPHARRYPYFLRSKTGGTQAFAFFVFPKTQYPNLREFIQAIPLISHWAEYTNDILSFHKEELAGETDNYVHLRAKVTGDKPLQVVKDLVDDALSTAAEIEKILHGEYLKAWQTFKV